MFLAEVNPYHGQHVDISLEGLQDLLRGPILAIDSSDSLHPGYCSALFQQSGGPGVGQYRHAFFRTFGLEFPTKVLKTVQHSEIWLN